MSFVDEPIGTQYIYNVAFYCGEMGKTVEATDCFKCYRELFCPYKTFWKSKKAIKEKIKNYYEKL